MRRYRSREYRYRTLARFQAALRRFTDDKTLVFWYGDDHHYVVVRRRLAR